MNDAPKLYIFDKDSTLIVAKSKAKFINRPYDQTLIPGTAEMLDRLVADGSRIVIASNQAGIAAGHKSLEDVFEEFRVCLQLCPQVTDAYFCPDFEGQVCWRVWGDCSEEHRIEYRNDVVLVPYGVDGGTPDGYKSVVEPSDSFRKPNPGMLKLAMQIEIPDEVLFIGDRPEDEAAAAAANIPFQWIWDVNPEYPQELRGR